MSYIHPSIVDDKDREIEELRRRLDARRNPEAELGRAADVIGLYNELLMAVQSKWPGETRHQTALRYIKRAEGGSLDGAEGCYTNP